MMVRDRRKTGFSNKVRQRHTQRNVHGNTQGILHNQQVEIISTREFIKRAFEIVSQSIDPLRDIGSARACAKRSTIDPLNIRMTKIGMWHNHRRLLVAVTQARIPMADMPVIPEHLRPLGTLEGHTIRARKPCTNKPNLDAHGANQTCSGSLFCSCHQPRFFTSSLRTHSGCIAFRSLAFN